jgi:hypothetical protein
LYIGEKQTACTETQRLTSADSSAVHGEAPSTTLFVSIDSTDSKDSTFEMSENLKLYQQSKMSQVRTAEPDITAVHGDNRSFRKVSPWTARTAQMIPHRKATVYQVERDMK